MGEISMMPYQTIFHAFQYHFKKIKFSNQKTLNFCNLINLGSVSDSGLVFFQLEIIRKNSLKSHHKKIFQSFSLNIKLIFVFKEIFYICEIYALIRMFMDGTFLDLI